MRSLFPVVWLVLPALALAAARGAEAEDVAFFEAKIRPLLAEHCLECHSVAAGKQKGGLLLDSKWGWETGGDSGPALVPGDPARSLILAAVRRTGTPVEPMPPKSALAPDQIALLEAWIARGAPDPRPRPEGGASPVAAFDLEARRAAHWCWRPVGNPVPPPVRDSAGARSPVDAFVWSRLEAAGLRPAAPADPRTWTRRVFLDLTGLPPAPEDLERFRVEDAAAFDSAAVVDHLLASPRFGETWARHWMDLVRYAETCGHEFDYEIPQAWRYRDYLIRAFNADVPYDVLVREHVAGDLLPEPRRHPGDETNESVLGTGFWYLHEAVHAPTEVLQDEADRMDNQIDVFGKAFLGLTVACARCHDHKFDAISTADYHALAGYLQGTCRTEVPVDRGRVRERTATAQRELRREATPLLAGLSAEETPGRAFLAALALVRQTRDSAATSPDAADIVVADFETGYAGWTVEGDAFGDAPATGTFPGQQTVDGFRGRGLVNSWNGSDGKTGTALSPEFVLARPHLHFLVGGGGHAETRVELLVDGQPVRVASGKNRERLEPQAWDVAEFAGRKARLRLVDAHRGGWGHVNADHFVLSREGVPAATAEPPEPDPGDIARTAAREGLDSPVLAAWCRLLLGSGPGGADGPDAVWAEFSRNPAAVAARGAEAARLRDELARFREASAAWESFGGEAFPEGWSGTGDAWAAAGPWPGASFLSGHPVSLPGTVSSAALGAEHVGTLRSRSFAIPAPRLHLRVRSRDVMLRVVPDNYHMAVFQPLLFRGTIRTGKETDTGDAFRWITLDGDLVKYVGHRAYLEIADAGTGHATVSEIRFSQDARPPQELPAVLDRLFAPGAVPTDERGVAQGLDRVWRETWTALRDGRAGTADAEVLDWFLGRGLVSAPAAWDSLLTRGRDLAAKLPPPEFALAMAQGTPVPGRVAIRGNPKNPGPEVPNRFLTALGGGEGTRLDLARAVASPDNPLTARVVVNRLWHHLFGTGLVPTVDDFGPMGQPPSHPELLDWLARDFLDHGWSLKHTLRVITLSSVYGQSCLSHPELDPARIATADPGNVLLHRMPVRRLTAESLRDGILAVSGRLDPTPFGPSVPTHRTEFMSGRGARGSGPLDGAGRRTVYLSVYRNFLNPFLLAFDMPNPFGPKGRRGTSNVPAQALALLNDPFVLDQARFWASGPASRPDLAGNPDARLAAMAERAWGRPPTAEERARLRALLGPEGQPVPDPAWADLAHVLFNSKDFLFVR
jgi:hypothetical protein